MLNTDPDVMLTLRDQHPTDANVKGSEFSRNVSISRVVKIVIFQS